MSEKLLEIPDEALDFLLPFFNFITHTSPESRTIHLKVPANMYNWNNMDYGVMKRIGIAEVRAKQDGLCNVPDRNGNNVGLGFSHYSISIRFFESVTKVVEDAPELVALPTSTIMALPAPVKRNSRWYRFVTVIRKWTSRFKKQI